MVTRCARFTNIFADRFAERSASANARVEVADVGGAAKGKNLTDGTVTFYH